jgi:hypothetical protein
MLLTFKEVNWRLQAISERKEDDLKISAKLHGLEFKKAKSIGITDEARKTFDKLLKGKQNGK